MKIGTKEIEHFLSMNEDDLYVEIHNSIYMDDTLGFSLEDKIKSGVEYFMKNERKIHELICTDWSYCSKRNDPDLQDSVSLFTLISDMLATFLGIIPPFAIAALLLKKGLNFYCKCKN